MRKIVLDTETTGISPKYGHRIIEIGCIELIDNQLTGNHFHAYINPERNIAVDATQVHGITAEFLFDKPKFTEITQAFIAFIKGAELIIHNAPFDVGFINMEFKRLHLDSLDSMCTVTDTLAMARRLFPKKRVSLDALCNRLKVDNSRRVLHGALLDAEILADVYLLMKKQSSAA